jgi:hypothetical protein
MTQSALNRAIAQATGETVDRIERMGFTLLVVPSPCIPRPRAIRARRRRQVVPTKYTKSRKDFEEA